MQRTLGYLNRNHYRSKLETIEPIITKAQAEGSTLFFCGLKTVRRNVYGVHLEYDWDGISEFSATYSFPRNFSHVLAGVGQAIALEMPIDSFTIHASTRIYDAPPHIIGVSSDTNESHSSFVFPDSVSSYILNDHMDQHLLLKVQQSVPN